MMVDMFVTIFFLLRAFILGVVFANVIGRAALRCKWEMVLSHSTTQVRSKALTMDASDPNQPDGEDELSW